jgi:rod shape-determining protein MreC
LAGEHTETNPLFSGASYGAARLTLYLLASVMLMAADHRSNYLDGIRSRLSLLLVPLVQTVELPITIARWLGEYVGDREQLSDRNDELEHQWLLTQARTSRLESLETENDRLRRLLDTSPRLGERVLIAEYLSIDLDPYAHRVALNKGRQHGVFEGQPLADAGGIVGQIDQVTEFSAFATLISDPSHAVPVVINRTGLRTLAYGNGRTDQLVLQDVSSSADVLTGDLVVTSGLGGRFPAGYPVARVEEVQRDGGDAFLTIIATPTAALDRSREVLLVWPIPRGEDRLVGDSANEGSPQ